MKYTSIDAEYPFEIPEMICTNLNWMAHYLGTHTKRIRDWITDGELPATSRTSRDHSDFWTEDEAKEAYIKGFILMHKGL